MFPPTPTFKGAMRLARLADLPRIGVVAAAAFYHSSWFAYERPYYNQYPLDTLASYRRSFLRALFDPDSIVVVVEDTLDETESNRVYNALASVYPPFDEQIPKDLLDQGKAVVAVASFSLLPDSARHGQFQPEGDNPGVPETPVLNRDKNAIASENMDKVLHPQEVETFKGRMVIDMMVTHPSHWRRGHGTLITKWFIDLARQDQVGLAVAAAPMGKVHFSSLGFKKAKTVEIPGYHDHPNPIYAWLGLLNVKQNGGCGGERVSRAFL
ncbi:hypothetical protein TOPH_07896 [Tolypocladium ophioglossoides CBS 100239]|uniref:N-acetyltransferase domain-containing protein n=1 Tax=Tolypocladium ophioglossoides (strain CBS 100239) TaxID=1163406 RepID=A0A0L0N122_TOLOC|nr:hypothetical protein TOPH_07896 [Tolypocladium ophioglossoides CBS 100239]